MNASDDFAEIRAFLEKAGIRPWHLVLPAALAAGAALCEGLTVALFIPLSRAVIASDYGPARAVPVLSALLQRLPSDWAASNRVVFVQLVVSIFICALVKNILHYASSLSVAFQVRRFANNLRKIIFNHYLGFGKLYFDRTNFGTLQGVLLNFTNLIAFRLIEFQQLFAWLFMLFAYLVIMFWISWKLSVAVLLLFPLLNYSLRWVVEKIKKSSSEYTEAQTLLSSRIFNVLSCILLVKSYVRERQEADLFAKSSDLVEKLEFSIDKKQNIMVPIQETIVLGLILLLISVAALIFTYEGASAVSGVLVYFYLIKRSALAFGVLNNLKSQLATVSGPVHEVMRVFNHDDKNFIPDGIEEFPGLARTIEFKGLDFGFTAGRPVLKDISLNIEKGLMTAIVGPSGTGKTTLINLLMRFYDSPPGALLIDGIDIRRYTLKSLRSRMALVSQDALVFNDTIRANITYGLEAVCEEALAAAVEKARLRDFISNLPSGLETFVGDRGVQLSGGERQRLSIARAMLKNADILILDEATSSLDNHTEKLIQEAIEKMVEGKTAIVIAHRLSTISQADRVVILEDGRLTETGQREELLKSRGRFYQYLTEQKFY